MKSGDESLIFDCAPEALIVSDMSGRLLRINHKAMAIFDDAKTGCLLTEIFDEADVELLFLVLKAQDEHFFEAKLTTREENPLSLIVKARKHLSANHERVVLSCSEATTEDSLVFERSGCFSGVAVGMARVSPEGIILLANSAVCKMLGYKENELVGKRFHDVTFDEDIEEDIKLLDELLRGKRNHYSLDKRYLHKAGHVVWGRLFVSLVRHSDGSPNYCIGVIIDIHEEKSLHHTLTVSENRFRALAENINSVVWLVALDNRQVLYINKRYESVWELPRDQLYALPEAILSRIHPDDKSIVEDVLTGFGSRDWNINYRLLFPDGRIKHIRDTGTRVADEEGNIEYLVGTATDITKEINQRDSMVNMAQKLRDLVDFDTLTSVFSRHAIIREISVCFRHFKRYHTPAVLVYLDADKFKQINDSHGHDEGDKVLCSIATHLKDNLREVDSIGRIGGDEFIVLLRNTTALEVEPLLERIQTVALDEIPDHEDITLSVGAVELDNDVESAQHWLQLADKAMYECKKLKNIDLDSAI